MKKISTREYTAEFKEQAVKHAQAMGIVVAAKELGLVEQTLPLHASSLSDLGRRKRKSAPARIVFDDFAGQYLDIGQESGEK